MYRLFALILLCVLIPHLDPQETINNAPLSGRITDTSGSVIPNAAVSAQSMATGLIFKTQTDAVGLYRFPYLPVGEYEVTIGDSGFSDTKRLVHLIIGAAFDFSAILTPQSAHTSVRVNDEAPVLET